MKTRRQFFGTLLRSAATAAALVYAPRFLEAPSPRPLLVNGLKSDLIKGYKKALRTFRTFKDNPQGFNYFESAPHMEFLIHADPLDSGPWGEVIRR